MAEETDIVEQVKRRITQDSRMSVVGVKQLLEGNPITNAEDRKRLAGHIFYLYGRADACPPRPPLPKSTLHDS